MTSKGWANNKRRDRLYIIADILNIATHGAIKSQIMLRANLSSALTKKYLPLLIERKLVDSTVKKGKKIFKTTHKGLQLLRSYIEIMETMELLSEERTPELEGRNSLICVVKNPDSPICTKRYV